MSRRWLNILGVVLLVVSASGAPLILVSMSSMAQVRMGRFQ